MNFIKLIIVFFVSLLVLSGCDWFKEKGPEIPFAPYGENYSEKMDFARLEYEYPLTTSDLMKITPENIMVLDQEQIDQIYGRLTAGPIPDGAFDGDLFFPRGTSGNLRVGEIVGGLGKLAVNLKTSKIESMGRVLWKGKVFYREERVLRNRIEDLAALKPLIDGSLLDIEKIEVDHKDAWLLFPAKLYCGQSLLDSRRESIIIDYAFTDTIPGYRERPDYLAGRNGFKVRDEIRMIRPGFYLGRAYLNRAFALNFILYNEAIAESDTPEFMQTGAIAEDCWQGEQARVAVK